MSQEACNCRGTQAGRKKKRERERDIGIRTKRSYWWVSKYCLWKCLTWCNHRQCQQGDKQQWLLHSWDEMSNPEVLFNDKNPSSFIHGCGLGKGIHSTSCKSNWGWMQKGPLKPQAALKLLLIRRQILGTSPFQAEGCVCDNNGWIRTVSTLAHG